MKAFALSCMALALALGGVVSRGMSPSAPMLTG